MTHGGRFALGVDSDEREGRERGSETVAAEMGDERWKRGSFWKVEMARQAKE